MQNTRNTPETMDQVECRPAYLSGPLREQDLYPYHIYLVLMLDNMLSKT